jgi:beta-ureidopropionase
MESKSISRRSFLGKSTATAGVMALGATGISYSANVQGNSNAKLPREVWIATTSQMGLQAETPVEMVEMMRKIMEKAIIHRPDIICLPETFLTANVKKKINLAEKLETSKKILEDYAAFARKNKCYLIVPVYTSEKGKAYNGAVVINRQGEKMGEYRKIHTTEGELRSGISPGPLKPPVFKTDFGTIGIQTCYDILWDDGWKSLRQQGAEMVFFNAAYSGGQTVNAKAWQHKYVVVSSTRKHTAKICDISGDEIVQTGFWDSNLICAPVNLEKAFLHTWPAVQKFDEIRAKYGRKIKITNYHEEEWSIIESLSPDVLVKDVLREFDIKTHEQHTADAEIAQVNARKK